MTIAPLREDEVIARLREIALATETKRILVGIGDDAAVWQPSRSHRSVITTDALVEGVHFTAETMSAYDAGWRAMTANLSDLAAMGARPVLATIALGVPAGCDVETLVSLYRGIAAAAKSARLAIAGGNLTRSPATTITIAAVGEVRATRCTLRSGAKAGDVVAVTGELGASRAGLDVARGAVTLGPEDERVGLDAHRHPSARLDEGRWLAASANVHAMIDCSDGLSTDLARLCESSGLGAFVEGIPVSACARAAAERLGEDPVAYALAGGEEYELIVAIARRAFAHLSERYLARFGRSLLHVGTLREGAGVFIARAGEQEMPVAQTGWDHFT
ncbi:MAG: thiamine-phosphate kinase [Candidatus Tyrphobacter sp.]